jgi:hypothetical protein
LPAAGAGDVVGQASSVDSEVALFSGTTGKIIKRATGTGLVTVTNGIYQTPISADTVGRMPRGHLAGLTAFNNATDLVNDADAVAWRMPDSGNAQDMALASTLTKTADAAWTVGTNQRLGHGNARPLDVAVHMFLIKRLDTGVVVTLSFLSPTAPTLADKLYGQATDRAVLAV